MFLGRNQEDEQSTEETEEVSWTNYSIFWSFVIMSIQFNSLTSDFDFRFIQKSPSVDLDHIFPTWHERCFDPKLSQSINKWVTCCVWWRNRKSFNITPVCWCLLTKKFRCTSPKDIQLLQRKKLYLVDLCCSFYPHQQKEIPYFTAKKCSNFSFQVQYYVQEIKIHYW